MPRAPECTASEPPYQPARSPAPVRSRGAGDCSIPVPQIRGPRVLPHSRNHIISFPWLPDSPVERPRRHAQRSRHAAQRLGALTAAPRTTASMKCSNGRASAPGRYDWNSRARAPPAHAGTRQRSSPWSPPSRCPAHRRATYWGFAADWTRWRRASRQRWMKIGPTAVRTNVPQGPFVVTWAVARSPSCNSGVQEVPLPEYACAVGAASRSTTTSLLRRPFSRAFSTSST